MFFYSNSALRKVGDYSILFFFFPPDVQGISSLQEFGKVKARLQPKNSAPAFTAAEEIAIGVLAGLIARFITTPISQVCHPSLFFDTAKLESLSMFTQVVVRLQTSATDSESPSQDDMSFPAQSQKRKNNIAQIVRDIYRQKGLLGFWSGYQSAMLLTLNPSISLYLFSALKKAVLPRSKQEHPPALAIFLTSALGSCGASLLMYPFILAKVRLMKEKSRANSIYQILWKAHNRRGIAGLYAGLDGQLAKNFLGDGVKLMVKERTELLIILLYRKFIHAG